MVTVERWVDVEDVAAHLGVAKDTAYRWIEERGLPAHRVGRLLRFKLSEIDEWVLQGSQQGVISKPARLQSSTIDMKNQSRSKACSKNKARNE